MYFFLFFFPKKLNFLSFFRGIILLPVLIPFCFIIILFFCITFFSLLYSQLAKSCTQSFHFLISPCIVRCSHICTYMCMYIHVYFHAHLRTTFCIPNLFIHFCYDLFPYSQGSSFSFSLFNGKTADQTNDKGQ